LRLHLSFLLLITLSVTACESLDTGILSDYPTRIEALSFQDLTILNEQFHVRNEDKLCSTLNQFGYTGFSRVLFSNDINPCTQREVLRVELTRTDSLLEKAMQSLYDNRDFTLVHDTTALEVIESTALEGCTICEGPDFNNVVIGWKFTFADQVQDGMEVSNSQIAVFLDAEGVNRIWGNWYPEFPDPGLLNIGYLQAQSVFEGFEIDLEPLIGIDSTFTISSEHLSQTPYQTWFPYITDESLEFRKTWNIPIDFDLDPIKGFIGRVDIMDGLVLDLEATGLTDGPLQNGSGKILVDN